jgi:Family of unknown function (DUF6178)
MFMLRTPKNLSQEIQEVSPYRLKGGLLEGNSVPWKPSLDNPLAPALLDIDWLTAQPLLPFLAQVAPAHLLYRSIMSHGMEDSVEVIEWVRGEQLQKMLDFDIWENSFEFQVGDISVSKFLSWLRIWMEIDPEFAAKRFLELEEETIVLIVSKIFEIIPDGVSQVTEDMRENWWQTADNKFFLRIRDESDDSFELLKPFVDSLYLYNVRIAASIFAHSTMLVRQESLEFGLRWKAARLADQGFVSKDDALKILAPKKLEAIKQSIKEAKELEKKRNEALEKSSFRNSSSLIEDNSTNDPELYENVVHFLSSLDPEEGVRYMQLALGSESLKQITGSQNIDPEYFYEDEDFISETAENIINICKKVLVRSEFVNSRTLNKQNLLIEQAFYELTNRDLDKALYLKDRVARLSNIFVSGLMNSIDNDALGRSIAIVRGILNIGLEICLLSPNEYGLNLDAKESEVDKSISCIQLLGPEYLFHLGWNILISLQKDLSKEIVEIDLNHINYKDKLKTIRKIYISDSSSLDISLDKLVENQRYPDISSWLGSIESHIPTELFLVLEAFFGRVPMYSELLSVEKIIGAMKVHTTFKPFETLNEIEKAKVFINNFHHNLVME